MDVTESLQALKTWLEENAEPLLDNLNPPATAADIDAAEAQMGLTYPEAVRQAYLCHNGETKNSGGIFGLWRWFSLEKVVAFHEEFRRDFVEDTNPDDPDTANRIPLMQAGGREFIFVEAQPGEAVRECVFFDEPNHIAPSFEAYLKDFVEKLHNGGYLYLPDAFENGLVDASEL